MGSKAQRTRNRRVRGQAKQKGGRVPLTPEARRARNRTVLMLAVLALVNAYVFVWRDGASLGGLGELGVAAIGKGGGPLPPIAQPPEEACGGDPARVFEGLEDLIQLGASLTGGDTLRLALLRLGTPAAEIDLLEASVRSKVDLGLLAGSGAPIRIAADRFGGIHAMEIELAEGHVLQACRTGEDAEAFEVRNLQHPLRTDVEVISLQLDKGADLSSSALASGEKAELADLVARTLGFDLDFLTEARPGDRIQVMVEKRWLGRRFHRYGAVLGIRLRGTVGRATYFRYKPEGGEADFFDGDGKPMRRSLLRTPVVYRRINPEARGLLVPSMEVVEGRIGAVYRVPEGTPVLALSDGAIRRAGRTLEEGNFIDLELPDGRVIRYAHLMRAIGELGVGAEVAQGQVIGLAGHTGQTPNDRLRLEIWESDDAGVMTTVDPMVLKRAGAARPEAVGDDIPPGQLRRFKEDVTLRRRALRSAR